MWLHVPDGYVGISAALEMGHARALGIPVFAATPPKDQTLGAYVTLVSSPTEVAGALVTAPGNGHTGLQAYYARVAARRGWDGESPRDTLLLLTEELGELARAVRKRDGLQRDSAYPVTDVADEVADVALYVVHLANTLGVDLAEAVTRKEHANEARHAAAARAA